MDEKTIFNQIRANVADACTGPKIHFVTPEEHDAKQTCDVSDVWKTKTDLPAGYSTEMQFKAQSSLSADQLEQQEGWTLASKELPTNDHIPYDVTVEAFVFGEKVRALEVLRYYGDGQWESVEGIAYKIVAWRKRPTVYEGPAE